MPVSDTPQSLAARLFAPQQGANEPNIGYWFRNPFAWLGREVPAIGQDIGTAVSSAVDTPAAAAARAVVARPEPVAKLDTSIAGLTEQLINRGIPGHVARGVSAGLIAESAGNPFAVNPDSGAFGFSQWLGSRKTELQRRYGAKPTPQQQLDFLAYELKGGDQGGKSVMSARTPDEALHRFVTDFARPAAGRETTGDLARGYRAMGYRDAEQRAGFSAPFVNPFDPTYANQALAQIDRSAELQKRPFDISGDVGPMPEAPAPTPVPKTDFSQADADLQALRPQEITLKEEKQIRWKSFWAGLGKGMAAGGNAGLGDFFLKLGGGALMGKAAGMEEIQAKHDEYDTKLAKWQAALYEHDFQKAQIQHQELLLDWKANQDYVQDKYRTALALWTKSATPQLVGNDVIWTKIGADGKVNVKGIPIPSMIDAEAARAKVGVLSGMFSAQNSANSQVTSMENQIEGQTALARAASILSTPSSTDEDKAAAAAYGVAQGATFAVESGQIAAVIGEEEAAKLNKEVQSTLTAQGIYPGSADYADAAKKMIAYKLGTVATMDTSGQMVNKLMALKPAADIFQNYATMQKDKSSTTTTVDSKGRVTRRTTNSSAGSNPFADEVTGVPYSDIGPYRRY